MFVVSLTLRASCTILISLYHPTLVLWQLWLLHSHQSCPPRLSLSALSAARGSILPPPSIFLLANPLPRPVTEAINSVTQTHGSHKEGPFRCEL